MSVILVIQEMEIGRNWVWLEASLGKKLAISLSQQTRWILWSISVLPTTERQTSR
jgi:hypothetical protein